MHPLMRRNTSIRYASELVFHFRNLLKGDEDLSWRLFDEAEFGPPRAVALDLGGRQLTFNPVFELRPSVSWLETLPPPPRNRQWLLVTPELSSRVLEVCKRRGVAAIDLNGRTWIKADGVLVDRAPRSEQSFRYALEPRNIFVGKSARIVRCLLTDRDRHWSQSEIVPRTGASPGLVSRIVAYLVSQELVEKTGARTFRISNLSALLDAWATADNLATRTQTVRYAGHIGPVPHLADRVQDWATRNDVRIAFTQWIAGWARHPYTEPPLVAAYVSRLPESAQSELALRTVEEGGKLWLYVPDDEGIFQEAHRQKNWWLATDAQIYLDLQRTGLRGPEQATALCEWEGFCRA